MAASDSKRKYLHQPAANSYHPSASRELSASSTHSARRVLRARRCWQSKIGRGYGVTSTCRWAHGPLRLQNLTQRLTVDILLDLTCHKRPSIPCLISAISLRSHLFQSARAKATLIITMASSANVEVPTLPSAAQNDESEADNLQIEAEEVQHLWQYHSEPYPTDCR